MQPGLHIVGKSGWRRATLARYDHSIASPAIQVLRLCDGRLCLRLVVFEPDRAREGDHHSLALRRQPDLSCRRFVLPDLVHFRRYLDGSLWLRPRPARGLGGLRGADLCILDGGHGRASAALGALARRSAGGGSDIRQHAAHRRRIDSGVSLRHFRQQLRARQDENLDPRSLAVDAARRLDLVRRTGRLGALHFSGVLWPHVRCLI